MIVTRNEGYREELARLTPSLRAFARALVDDHATETADEIVQTALLAALGDAQERRGTRLKIWMLSHVLSAHRRAVRDASADQQTGTHKAAQQGMVGGGKWDAPRRTRTRDASLLDHMPLECRETLLLVVLEQLTYVQAAECLGTTLNTVIGNLARGRDILSRKVGGATTTRVGTPAHSVPYLRVVK